MSLGNLDPKVYVLVGEDEINGCWLWDRTPRRDSGFRLLDFLVLALYRQSPEGAAVFDSDVADALKVQSDEVSQSVRRLVEGGLLQYVALQCSSSGPDGVDYWGLEAALIPATLMMMMRGEQGPPIDDPTGNGSSLG